MKVIMNPPYDKNLHLKILREAMKHSDDIVNLSPIRWLQDPLAERKQNTDYKKFADIREHIESLEEITALEASTYFRAAFYTSLGIYHITKERQDFKIERNPIIEKIIDFPCAHFTYNRPEEKKYKIVLPATHGNAGMKSWEEITSKDYEIAKNVKETSATNSYVVLTFDTEEEHRNFYDSLFTKFYRYLVKNIKSTAATAQYIKFVPVMPTYKHKWTDNMLYEYFQLTNEDIEEIETGVK